MKLGYFICFLGLLLFIRCGGAVDDAGKLAAREAAKIAARQLLDNFVAHVTVGDDAFTVAREAHKLGQSTKALAAADQAIQATQQARILHSQAIQSALDAQQSEKLTQHLRRLENIEQESKFIKLEAQADIAIASTTNELKSGQGRLANATESELNEFVKDLLCFHLEGLANEQQLPSKEDYQDFLRDYAISRFVSDWEIKKKAEDIIEFAENASKPQSDGERRARMRLLQECTLRSSQH